MDWTQFALVDAPKLIGFGISVAEKIKGAKGPDKEAAVIAAAHDALPAVEGALHKDIVNDAAFDALLASYIQSRVALANFLTKKSAVPEGVVLPVASS